MKEAISTKKVAHRSVCRNSTENRNMHKSTKNKAKKAVSKAMREKAEEVITELKNCAIGMFRLVRGLKIDMKEVAGEDV